MKLLLGVAGLMLSFVNAEAIDEAELATNCTMFKVYNFTAGAIQRSNLGYIEFSWSADRGANITTCNEYPTDESSFPFIAQTLCDDRTMSFNITRAIDGGADLRLWHEKSQGLFRVAVHHIPPEQIVESNSTLFGAAVPVYGGPRNFVVQQVWEEALNITFGPGPGR